MCCWQLGRLEHRHSVLQNDWQMTKAASQASTVELRRLTALAATPLTRKCLVGDDETETEQPRIRQLMATRIDSPAVRDRCLSSSPGAGTAQGGGGGEEEENQPTSSSSLQANISTDLFAGEIAHTGAGGAVAASQVEAPAVDATVVPGLHYSGSGRDSHKHTHHECEPSQAPPSLAAVPAKESDLLNGNGCERASWSRQRAQAPTTSLEDNPSAAAEVAPAHNRQQPPRHEPVQPPTEQLPAHTHHEWEMKPAVDEEVLAVAPTPFPTLTGDIGDIATSFMGISTSLNLPSPAMFELPAPPSSSFEIPQSFLPPFRLPVNSTHMMPSIFVWGNAGDDVGKPLHDLSTRPPPAPQKNAALEEGEEGQHTRAHALAEMPEPEPDGTGLGQLRSAAGIYGLPRQRGSLSEEVEKRPTSIRVRPLTSSMLANMHDMDDVGLASGTLEGLV